MKRSATVIIRELVTRSAVTSLRHLVFFLFCMHLPLSFFSCYSKRKVSLSPRCQTMPAKAFGAMFGNREICPDDRRLVASFSPYARLNVNHVLCSTFNDLVQQITILCTLTWTLVLRLLSSATSQQWSSASSSQGLQ